MTISTIEELQDSLTPQKRTAVLIGCIFLMITVSAFGLSLSTIQQPLLDRMNEGAQFSLVTVLTSIALCIMTPVGGRLGDMIGAKKVVLYSGLTVIISSVLLALSSTLIPFIAFRFTLSLGMGAYVSAPFLMVREIYPLKDVPKMMGLLTTALALGSLIGSYGSGVLMDSNLVFLAVCFPSIFLILGIPLVYFNLPNKPVEKGATLDVAGFALLTGCLAGVFLALNYGPKLGWTNGWVITGLAGGILLGAAFFVFERKIKEPLIPMQLFKNKQFSLILFIAFLSFFYLNAMNVYAPLAVQTVMEQSTSVSGTLQVPRTIALVLLPAIAGVWVVKKPNRYWQALAIAMLLIFVPFLGLVFTGPNMPVWFIMLMLGLNGVGDCFRAVSITPAAQSLLPAKQLGIGTSLMSFVTSLAGVFASSIYGIIYDGLSAANPTMRGVINGLDTVFLFAAATGLLGLLLTVFCYRPMELASTRAKRKQAA